MEWRRNRSWSPVCGRCGIRHGKIEGEQDGTRHLNGCTMAEEVRMSSVEKEKRKMEKEEFVIMVIMVQIM